MSTLHLSLSLSISLYLSLRQILSVFTAVCVVERHGIGEQVFIAVCCSASRGCDSLSLSLSLSLYLSLSLSLYLSLSGKFYLYSQLWVWSNVTGWGGNWSPRSVTTSGWTYINQFLGVFIYMWIFGEIVSLLQNFDLNGAEAKSEREKINR